MNFASVEDTRMRLETAGFSDLRVWTHPYPVTPKDPRGYLSTVSCPGTFTACHQSSTMRSSER